MKHILFFLSALLFFSDAFAQDKAFSCGIDIHGGIGTSVLSHYSAGADFVCVWQANSHVQLGAGAGYQHTDALKYLGMSGAYRKKEYGEFDGIRLFVREKASLSDGNIAPFVCFDEGGTIGLKRSGSLSGRQATQLFFEPGVGVDIKLKGGGRIGLSLGYLSQHTCYTRYTIAKDGTSMLDNFPMIDYIGQIVLHVGFMF